MKFDFLEHTADMKFQASGRNLEQAFEASALATKQTIAPEVEVKSKIEKCIKVAGEDMESLLYNFLEEILFLLDAKDFLVSKIESIKISKERIELDAVVSGDKASNYKFSNNVKAITYNQMFVKFDEEKKQWICQVVLDV